MSAFVLRMCITDVIVITGNVMISLTKHGFTTAIAAIRSQWWWAAMCTTHVISFSPGASLYATADCWWIAPAGEMLGGRSDHVMIGR